MMEAIRNVIEKARTWAQGTLTLKVRRGISIIQTVFGSAVAVMSIIVVAYILGVFPSYLPTDKVDNETQTRINRARDMGFSVLDVLILAILVGAFGALLYALYAWIGGTQGGE